MQPTEAINLVEKVLRDLIREVMGDEWRNHPSLDIARLEEKRADDQAKRRGVVGTDDLIEFLEFFHLRDIIHKNWPQFEGALGKKKYFTVYMDRLEGFRNPAMHSRDLLPFEVSLVHGIVGEINNLVTIYRSQKGPDMNYYPEVLRIRDETHGFDHKQRNALSSEVILRPGNRVEFRCSARDPQGRELRWFLYTLTPSRSANMRDQAVGDDVTLVWDGEPHDVQALNSAIITVESDGKYHRLGNHDDRWELPYRVDPELEAT